MVGVNMTPCNWGVSFAPNARISLEFDKECVGVNEFLYTV